jgi:hypothetical protein
VRHNRFSHQLQVLDWVRLHQEELNHQAFTIARYGYQFLVVKHQSIYPLNQAYYTHDLLLHQSVEAALVWALLAITTSTDYTLLIPNQAD